MSRFTATYCCLIFLHALGGLIGWFFCVAPSFEWPWGFVYQRFLMSQAMLVGMWGALATCRSSIRIAGMGMGIIYFFAQVVYWHGTSNVPNVSFFLVPMVVVAGAIQFARMLSRREFLLKFSIRDLLSLTLLICLLAAFGKWAALVLPIGQLVELVGAALLSLFIGGGSAWAMLYGDKYVARSCAVLILGLVTVCTIEVCSLLLTLYVVRSSGFRLCFRKDEACHGQLEGSGNSQGECTTP